MKIIDVLGKPCPIPVIEAKKALAEYDGVLVKVDNIVAVQNLEKLAKGLGYDYSYVESAGGHFVVQIGKTGNFDAELSDGIHASDRSDSARATVVISKNTMGEGAEELGKILIKSFIYSLTELAMPPESVVFLNSGAYLTTDGSNTIDDLKALEEKGVEILTCGTCVNYYGLNTNLAVGSIANMYEIVEKMAFAANMINI